MLLSSTNESCFTKSLQLNCVEWLVHDHDDGVHHALCLSMADVFTALTLVVVVILTVIGNTLVVLSVAIYKRMRTFTNVFLVSLATADFLVGVLIMPIALVDLMQNHHWTFGRIVCKLWTTADVFLCTASILNLCVISLDRYFAITSPLIYTRTRSHKLAVGLVASVWLLSMVTCSPPLLVPGWQFQFDDPYVCGYVKAITYRVYSALCSFYIPLLIMLVVYLKIYRVANNREKLLSSNGESRRSSKSMQIWQGSSSRSKQDSMIRSTTSVVGQYKTTILSPRSKHSSHHRNNNYHRQFSTPSPIRPRNVDIMRSMHEISYTADESSCTDHYRNDTTTTTNYKENASSSTESAETVCKVDSSNSISSKKRVQIAEDGNSTPLLVSTPSMDAKSWSSFSLHESSKLKIGGSSTSTTSTRTNREKLMYLKERKALKTIGVVVSGFVVCWLPFFVLYIVEVVCDSQLTTSPILLNPTQLISNFTRLIFTNGTYTNVSQQFYENINDTNQQEASCKFPPFLADIFLWLGYSNSALNP